MIGRVSFATIDAADPDRLAAFWSEVLGTQVEEISDEGRFVFLGEANGFILSFQRVPEPKSVKNRMHLDIRVEQLDEATDAVLALAAVTIAPAAAVSGPQRILAGPEDQLLASVNDTYLIWTENSVAFPNRYHAYGRVRGTSDVFRLNPPGTRGYAGGIDPGRDAAVYQQIEGRSSDLYRIDLGTRERHRLPAVIDSARWEWGPRVSNAFYFFARDASGATTLFLYDRASKTMEKLVSLDLTRFYVAPGSVGERYATWTVCGPRHCNAYIRDTETDLTRRIPAPDGSSRYAAVVHEAEGQVYFVRSGPTCGSAVRIMRLAVADLVASPVVLLTLPAGIDVDLQMSLEQVGARVHLWFARYRCAPQQGDIYRLRDVGLA